MSETTPERRVYFPPILRYFEYDHLAAPLARVAVAFHVFAEYLADALPEGPEGTTALRKLLEAKDAAVRAALDLPDSRDQGDPPVTG